MSKEATNTDDQAIAMAVLFPILYPFVWGWSCLTALPFAFVLKDLWAWFVAPAGAPPITWAGAYGLLLVFGLFTRNMPRMKTEGSAWKKIGVQMSQTLIGPPTIWITGWIVQAYFL